MGRQAWVSLWKEALSASCSPGENLPAVSGCLPGAQEPDPRGMVLAWDTQLHPLLRAGTPEPVEPLPP